MDTADLKPEDPEDGGGATRAVRKQGQNGSVSRRLILDMAAALFSHQGFTETTVRQIAAKVGMQAGSVYYHFESKEQMLGEILSIAVRSTYMAVKGSVESLPIEATPKDKIKAAIRAHLQSLHGNFDYTATNVKYQGQVPNVVERAVQPDRESYTEYWNQLIAAAAAAGELSPDLNLPFLRPLILGSLNRTINWYDPGRGDIETLVRTVLVLFDGLWSRAEAAGSEGGGST